MPKFLAIADTQIGVSTVTLEDQAAVLERIAEVAVEHGVDGVLHGGDVFEGPHVTPEQIRVFIDYLLEPLRACEIPLLAIRGNGRHDSAVRTVHALDVFREIEGIVIHDRPGIGWFAGVNVCTLPWVHPGTLLARLDGEVEHDHANTAMARLLVQIAADLRTKAASHMPCVLLAHWAITGAKLPSGLAVEEMREPVLPWAELDALGYDLIVGAHIHEPQRLGLLNSEGRGNQEHLSSARAAAPPGPEIDRTPGIVLGSPQQLNHGEKGDHGCWLIDIPGPAGEDVRTEFVPIESRPFLTLDVTLGADGSVELSGGPDSNAVDGAIVRIRYSATEDQARRVDHSLLRQMAADAGASRVTIEPTIIREARARSAQINEQLGPVESLAAYCDAQGIADPVRGRMLDLLQEWIEAA